MSSFDGSEVAGQFLHLGLELGLNLGQSSTLSFGAFELVILLAELVFQFGNSLLGGLQLEGVSSSS